VARTSLRVSNPLPPQSGKHHRGSPLPPKPRPTDPLINPEVARELYKKLEEAEVKLPIIHNTYHIDSLEKLTQPAYSVPVWRRITTRSVNLGGVPLPAGAKLFLWLAASGSDTSVFPNPEIFHFRRTNAPKALGIWQGHPLLPGSDARQARSAIGARGLDRAISTPALGSRQGNLIPRGFVLSRTAGVVGSGRLNSSESRLIASSGKFLH
jgi:hypothetical protein